MFPLAAACVPWGVLTGALSVQVGLTPLQGILMSALVFAGAAQLTALNLVGAHASPLAILSSTAVVSSRHLLYSMTFQRYVRGKSLLTRWALGFLLTDELFAVSEADTLQNGTFDLRFAFWSGTTFYVLWVVATAAGIYGAQQLHDIDALGLDFAICATFIAMTFNQLNRRGVLLTILVSGGLSSVLADYLPNAFIVVAALFGMLSGYLVSNSPAGGTTESGANQ